MKKFLTFYKRTTSSGTAPAATEPDRANPGTFISGLRTTVSFVASLDPVASNSSHAVSGSSAAASPPDPVLYPTAATPSVSLPHPNTSSCSSTSPVVASSSSAPTSASLGVSVSTSMLSLGPSTIQTKQKGTKKKDKTPKTADSVSIELIENELTAAQAKIVLLDTEVKDKKKSM